MLKHIQRRSAASRIDLEAPENNTPLNPVLARIYASRELQQSSQLRLDLDCLLPPAALTGVDEAGGVFAFVNTGDQSDNVIAVRAFGINRSHNPTAAEIASSSYINPIPDWAMVARALIATPAKPASPPAIV